MRIGAQLSALLGAAGASALPSQGAGTRTLSLDIPSALTSSPLYGAPANDFGCRSGRNPVVLLHGLSANRETDLNQLQHELKRRGYCTYSLTYGAHAVPAWVGGLRDMRESAAQVAGFVRDVAARTGAARVDVVGHSEGAVQAVYVPLTQAGIAPLVEHVVALAPAIHGATYFGFTDLWYLGGAATRALVGAVVDLLGCPACEQLAPDGLVTNQFAAASGGGGIVQEGNKVTVIMSTADALVPVAVSTIDEPGVRNVLVQTTCPDDPVGHAGMAWDKSVWRLVINALEETDEEVYSCEKGLPF
ncbi:putative lipase class 2 protein [Rosellinia necatrix]|uniref:Putative lipase class 2 protein n=1 Tax=Rosellinia necatrix TaxID=77044 RepID=A0A1W2TTD5_ROSNE|nr:putative lipase class 2 protein [Rosellinia necatrix]